ncbi:GMC oxidoreductase [Streptomyces sp. NPDC058525]|uniref:GMC oxidoreductase n=1 Tax=Streptomyces sp. NPDC058525 TaxID=3346538 RepID=UPI00364B61B9
MSRDSYRISGLEVTDADHAMLPNTARTIVVGAGLAGQEVVGELSRRGVRDVLLIEAGPADDLRHVNVAHAPETALRMWLEPTTDSSFVQPWTSRTAPHYTGSSGIRRRLGGRALYWYGVTLQMEDWALTEPAWPAAVVRDLRVSWRGGPSLYAQVERRLREWAERTETGSEPVALPRQVDAGSIRLMPTPLTRRTASHSPAAWYAYSGLDDWRDPVTGKWHGTPPGTRLLTGTEVVNIVVRDGRARGVMIRRPGSDLLTEVSAENIVLCAGTMENSRLSLQALTPADHSGPATLPGLADHIVQGLFLRLEGASAARLMEAVPVGSYYASYDPPARSNLFVDVHPQDANGGVLVEIRAMGEQLDQGTSRVEVTPADSYPWPTSVHSVPSEADRLLIAAQQQIVRDCYAQVCAIAGVRRREFEFAAYGDPERGNALALPESIATMPFAVPTTWSNLLGTEDHEGGTLPLGEVLDEQHEFRAISGLFAAGPSTFPRLGAANPSLTTMALAHRLAALLADRLTSDTPVAGMTGGTR